MPLTVEERKAQKRDYDKKYSQKYRENNLEQTREASRKAAKNARQTKREMIAAIKNVPCMDCGIKYPPYVMDFDHVRGEKEFTIARKAHGRTVETLLNEISKCEIVCSNCHRIRTHERRTNS
jgi:hypothetical protein